MVFMVPETLFVKIQRVLQGERVLLGDIDDLFVIFGVDFEYIQYGKGDDNHGD